MALLTGDRAHPVALWIAQNRVTPTVATTTLAHARFTITQTLKDRPPLQKAQLLALDALVAGASGKDRAPSIHLADLDPSAAEVLADLMSLADAEEDPSDLELVAAAIAIAAHFRFVELEHAGPMARLAERIPVQLGQLVVRSIPDLS